MSGFVAIHRGLFDHPCFKPEPFTEREAWIWLINEAAWKPKTVRVGRHAVSIQRGQLAHATRYMAQAWKWDHTRVWRFLKRLAQMEMIATAAQHDYKVITICNYDKYQSPRNADATPDATAVQQPCNKEEQINNITIDRDSARPSEVHSEFLKIARSDVDDPTLWGSIHQIDALLHRGFTRETILAGAASAMRGRVKAPPWNYFAKCIESENEQRSAPARKEIEGEKSGNVIAAADRLVERMRQFDQRPGDIRGGASKNVVGLLPQRRGE